MATSAIVSQVVTETLVPQFASSVVSQVVTETIVARLVSATVSQVLIEAITALSFGSDSTSVDCPLDFRGVGYSDTSADPNVAHNHVKSNFPTDGGRH